MPSTLTDRRYSCLLVSLAIHVVSWTRFAGCMSRPLFPDMVLSSRRLPSLPRVPASLVPRSRRYYEGATLAYQTAPSLIALRFSLLPPQPSRDQVCVHPSCSPRQHGFSVQCRRHLLGKNTAMRATCVALLQGPSLRSRLCCPGPSSLNRPHPPHSQAHRDFVA
jgi:hypothetical protein